MAHGAQGFHPPDPLMENVTPSRNSVWSQRSTKLSSLPPVARVGGYGNQPSGMGHRDFDYIPPPHAKAPTDFMMKQGQVFTSRTPKSDESVIQALWDPGSQTIDADLQLQHKTIEEGIITSRLLPSSKMGCILGQGGQVINEMRRRTKWIFVFFQRRQA
ncbi:hypothetical protein HAX54_036537 [Datura stramonium]|uniref:K Homology domain-containing protein n=1 Tax=Datura stramonium TaxID=4076 RepID=A0ABS8SGG1_DATST|nr:hypothetical protein [Datura stramonium]